MFIINTFRLLKGDENRTLLDISGPEYGGGRGTSANSFFYSLLNFKEGEIPPILRYIHSNKN